MSIESGFDAYVTRIHASISYEYFRFREYRKSIEYCEKSLAKAERNGDYYFMYLALFNLGASSHSLGYHLEALEYYTRSKQMSDLCLPGHNMRVVDL